MEACAWSTGGANGASSSLKTGAGLGIALERAAMTWSTWAIESMWRPVSHCSKATAVRHTAWWLCTQHCTTTHAKAAMPLVAHDQLVGCRFGEMTRERLLLQCRSHALERESRLRAFIVCAAARACKCNKRCQVLAQIHHSQMLGPCPAPPTPFRAFAPIDRLYLRCQHENNRNR